MCLEWWGVHSGVETWPMVSSINFSISKGFGLGTEKLASSVEDSGICSFTPTRLSRSSCRNFSSINYTRGHIDSRALIAQAYV